MVLVFSPTSLRDTRLDAVKQEYEEDRYEYRSIKLEQEDMNEDAVHEGNAACYSGSIGLTENCRCDGSQVAYLGRFDVMLFANTCVSRM
jgi:hypothetical protein